MTCMKARDYLILIKWLDLQRGNNLSRFCLVPKFQMSQANVFEIRGVWNEHEEPEIGEGFEYLLDFYVLDDHCDPPDTSSMPDTLNGVRVIVCPGRVECDATIPGEMLRDKIAAAIRQHDTEWEERRKQNNIFARIFGY